MRPAMSDAGEPPFDVHVRRADDATVLGFEGDLDLVSAQVAGTALLDAQASGGTVVLDLRGLRFIDSSGLRVILEARRRAGEGGARLLVAPGEDVVRRVLSLSGVGGLLDLVDAPPEDR